MEPATTIIERSGGHEAVAEIAGVTIVTVYRWTYPANRGGTDGNVPVKYQPALLANSDQKELGLTRSDFFPSPTAAPARAAVS